MTKGERDALISLARRRARVAMQESESVAAERMADFELQMDTRYAFDSDEVWAAAVKAAEYAVAQAQEVIAQRCRDLGIPEQCAPGLDIAWHGRGRNAVLQERAEMRRVAKTRIEALRVAAVAAVQRANVDYETTLVAGMLESEAARLALEAMPSISAMMPAIDPNAVVLDAQARRRISYRG